MFYTENRNLYCILKTLHTPQPREFMKYLSILIVFISFFGNLAAQDQPSSDKTVLLAILARNKAHTLPTYLACIDHLDYDKKLITLYVNTNNNDDNTKEILTAWLEKNKEKYRNIDFVSADVKADLSSKPHEWNAQRFSILAKIRNESLKKALEHKTDFYFVVDCDNFITPCTLKELIAKDKPFITPMLKPIPEVNDTYSNFFCDVSPTGYYKAHPDYMKILKNQKRGTFKVPVAHCTYLIKSECLDKLNYIDGTSHHEFVVFSRCARNNNIDQYVCNEKDFGTLLHFHNDKISLADEAARFQKYLDEKKD